jgi:predicted porin
MKKVLALAIAAAVTAPMAVAADVVVYGKAHVSIDTNDIGDKELDNLTDNVEVNSRSSRLGFKGSEDLGNGLKAIFQYEMTYNGLDGDGQATPAAITSARNSYIGLAGGWGTFLVGRHDTPTKVAYYAAGVEELGDSILDMNTGGTGDGLSRASGNVSALFREFRANNAIAYISPSFGGFTVAAAAVPGESAAPCGDECDGIADHYSVSAMYGGGGLKASIGYESKLLTSAPGGDEEDILQVGASYTFGSFKVGAMYQDISNYNSSDDDADAWALNVAWKFGNSKLIGQYGEGSYDNVVDKETYGVGLEHMFSKRTSAYVAYANADWDFDNGTDTDGDQFSLGMIHKF